MSVGTSVLEMLRQVDAGGLLVSWFSQNSKLKVQWETYMCTTYTYVQPNTCMHITHTYTTRTQNSVKKKKKRNQCGGSTARLVLWKRQREELEHCSHDVEAKCISADGQPLFLDFLCSEPWPKHFYKELSFRYFVTATKTMTVVKLLYITGTWWIFASGCFTLVAK